MKGRRAERERERERERESEGSAWIKRKVCGGRDVSVAEAACLLRPLLALRPALRADGERSPEQRVKDRDIASLCARTPFPSFIYLCLPAAGNARLSPALSSVAVPLFLCRTVYVRDGPARFEVLTRHRRYLTIYTPPYHLRFAPYMSHTYTGCSSKFPRANNRRIYKILYISAKRSCFEQTPNITTLTKRGRVS